MSAAEAAAWRKKQESPDHSPEPSNVIEGRFGVAPSGEDELDAVARVTDPEPDEEPTS